MRLRLPLLAAMLAVLCADAAQAGPWPQSLSFSLLGSDQMILPGSSYTYQATLTNTDTVPDRWLYLNGDNPSGLGPGLTVTSWFFDNAPFGLQGGESWTGDLFTIDVASDVGPGEFAGTFEILGGADPFAQDSLGIQTYHVNTTPEPGTVVLLLAGGGLAAARARRRRRPQ